MALIQILEAFDLLKPKLEAINWKTHKTVHKSKTAFFMDLAIQLVPLAVAGFFLSRAMKSFDPEAGKKRESEELRKQLAEKLRQANKPMITLSDQYETTVLNDITLPHTIDVTFADIGGYTDIKNDLYETVILPLQSPELFINVNTSSSSHAHTLLSPPRGVLFYGYVKTVQSS
jgi:SpoVK/Ycf46/Vps4 family AAA+-type ATPase